MSDKETKPKRKYFRKKVGMVFRINLQEDGNYAYGQVATETKHTFFDHLDKDGNWTHIEEIIQKPVAFYATVDNYVLKEGLWEILGVWPVNPENQVFPAPFGYNSFKGHETYFIWQNHEGKSVTQEPCTLEETYGRELLASWGHGSIEQRLRDHFAGRPNYDLTLVRSLHLDRNTIPSRKDFYAQYGYNFHWLDD